MENKNIRQIVSTVLKAVAAAMGIAVVVLNQMGQMDMQSAISMLGIGLACAGLAMLEKK